jgi:hypothetical protein
MKCPCPGVETDVEGTYVHLELVGPTEQSQAAMRWVYGLGGNVVRSGPYTDGKMFPKVDVERFLILAHIPS